MTLSSRILVFLAVLYVAFAVRYRIIGSDGTAWREIINNDGKGYYQHLRGLLVEGAVPEPWMLSLSGEGSAIKFFCGTAVLQAPFALAAHAWTLFFSAGPEDGYSIHYQIAVLVSALISFLIGLHFTRKLLLRQGFCERSTGVTILLLSLGTGLPIYAIWHPGMSHIHSFMVVAAAIYAFTIAIGSDRNRPWIAFGVLAGLMILLRPLNAILLLCLPFFIPTGNPHIERRKLLISIGSAVLVSCIQPVIWYLQSGSFLGDPYSDEGFHFLRPALLLSWSSARNGLFFYWPVLLLIFPGLLLLSRKDQRRVWPLAITFFLFAYISSSWWNWSYGTSFGQRNYVDLTSLLAIPIAAVVSADTWRKWTWLLIPIVALNLFQCWQYVHGLIDPGEFTARKYVYSFLNTDPYKAASIGGRHDLPPYAPRGIFTVVDTVFQEELVIEVPPAGHGGGEWFLSLEATSFQSMPFVPSMVSITGSSSAIPSNGIHFQLEHVPMTEEKPWPNEIRLRALNTGDRMHVSIRPADRIRNVRLRLMAPR